MKLLTQLAYSLLSCSLCLSCHKDEKTDTSPMSKNYWSEAFCKLNDKEWEDCQLGISGSNQTGAHGNWHRSSVGQPLTIEFINLCDSSLNKTGIQSIFLVVQVFKGIGKYPLDDFNYASCINLYPTSRFRYITSSQYTGEMNVTKFDSIKQVVSGNFAFQAYYSDSNSTLTVKDGIFNEVQFNIY